MRDFKRSTKAFLIEKYGSKIKSELFEYSFSNQSSLFKEVKLLVFVLCFKFLENM